MRGIESCATKKKSIRLTCTGNINLNISNIDYSRKTHKGNYLLSSHRAPLKPAVHSRGQ